MSHLRAEAHPTSLKSL